MGCGSKAHLSLKLSTRWRWVANLMFWLLHSWWKSPSVLLHREKSYSYWKVIDSCILPSKVTDTEWMENNYKWWIGEDLVGDGHDLFWGFFKGIHWRDWGKSWINSGEVGSLYLNQALLKYKPTTLALYCFAQYNKTLISLECTNNIWVTKQVSLEVTI